jgi:hypothetical protein
MILELYLDALVRVSRIIAHAQTHTRLQTGLSVCVRARGRLGARTITAVITSFVARARRAHISMGMMDKVN